MIKRICLTIVSVLMLVMLVAAPALAWDVEDSCVAANEDFIAGGGVDGTVWETQSGEQPWPYGKNPNEGYNLYRDDVTDTGNLDQAFILTFTPDEVDLPIIQAYDYPVVGEYWYMGDVASDTWYWATEPRGYNTPTSVYSPDTFTVNILGSIKEYKWEGGFTDGHVLRDAVDLQGTMNGCQLRLYIPAGTVVNEDAVRGYKLRVNCYQDRITVKTEPSCLTFSEPAILYRAVNGAWEEVVTFTELSNGQEL